MTGLKYSDEQIRIHLASLNPSCIEKHCNQCLYLAWYKLLNRVKYNNHPAALKKSRRRRNLRALLQGLQK